MAKIAVKGLDKLLKQFDQFGDDVKKMADAELEDGSREIAELAKKAAPANFGKLRQGIQFERVKDLRYEVTAHESYSGYVEFGTGIQVQVPSELKDIAQSLKGQKNGDFDTALKSIQDWCRGKGIDERAAYPILVSILNKGLRPQPFLYPSWVKGGENTVKRIEKAYEKEVNKFNSKK